MCQDGGDNPLCVADPVWFACLCLKTAVYDKQSNAQYCWGRNLGGHSLEGEEDHSCCLF